ncbi:MAG: hypothetical protein K1X81_01620 [Bacteroidia bacterium]|nr:hypothetical protein [Bacteroidia bacterium]
MKHETTLIIIGLFIYGTLFFNPAYGGNINDSLAIREKARIFSVPENQFEEFYKIEKAELSAAKTMMAPPPSLYTSPCSNQSSYSSSMLSSITLNTLCTNPDFENGNLSGWYCTYGDFDNCSVNNPHCTNVLTSGAPFPGRHTIMNVPKLDPYGKFPVIAPGGNYSVRLGNNNNGAESEELIYKVKVTADKALFVYRYAAVLEDPGHSLSDQPFFEVAAYSITQGGNLVPCSQFKVIPTAPPVPSIKDLQTFGPGYYAGKYSFYGGRYKEWSTNVIDLSPYVSSQEEVVIIFKTSDCRLEGHFGYAYIDAYCTTEMIDAEGDFCAGANMEFTTLNGNESLETFDWKAYAGTCTTCTSAVQTGSGASFNCTFADPGVYTIVCNYSYENYCKVGACSYTFRKQVTIDNCDQEFLRCEQCIGSFAPLPGKKYIVSAWVKEEVAPYTNPPLTYTQPYIKISFPGISQTYDLIKASGPIIDGWQKIDFEFIIPEAASKIEIKLMNAGTGNVYFDDVRIYPFDGAMKSYVFDPFTNRLMAEMDENNYATFYEYDEEGNLIRVKKETERGIKTIKESQKNIKLKTQ